MLCRQLLRRCFIALAMTGLLSASGYAQDETAALRSLLSSGQVEPGEDFTGAIVPGVSCKGLDLHGTAWDGAELRGALFEGVDLTRASFVDANLRGAVLRNCDLAGATLTGAELSGAVFDHVCLAGADLTGATLQGTSFEAIIFSPAGSRFSDALLLALNGLRQQAGETELSPTFVAGMSGEAFWFVYNSQDPAMSMGIPFAANPLVKALQSAGCKADLVVNTSRTKAFGALDRTLKAGGTVRRPG